MQLFPLNWPSKRHRDIVARCTIGFRLTKSLVVCTYLMKFLLRIPFCPRSARLSSVLAWQAMSTRSQMNGAREFSKRVALRMQRSIYVHLKPISFRKFIFYETMYPLNYWMNEAMCTGRASQRVRYVTICKWNCNFLQFVLRYAFLSLRQLLEQKKQNAIAQSNRILNIESQPSIGRKLSLVLRALE